MTAYANLSEMINRHTGGNNGTPEFLWMWKDSRVAGAAAAAPIAGRMTSLWQYEGVPAHGAVPSSVAIPDNTTNGGWKQTDPGGGRQKWMSGVVAGANVQGVLILYDRLLHVGGFDATVTSAQTVGGTLTRYTNGLGNQLWAEIYTQVGATATTISASYTDQDGNASQTTPAVVFGGTNAREAQRIVPLGVASGDIGVRACASVTVLATTGTAGNFGLTIAHPLLVIPIAGAGLGGVADRVAQIPGPIEIPTDACLAWAFLPASATAPNFMATLSAAER